MKNCKIPFSGKSGRGGVSAKLICASKCSGRHLQGDEATDRADAADEEHGAEDRRGPGGCLGGPADQDEAGGGDQQRGALSGEARYLMFFFFRLYPVYAVCISAFAGKPAPYNRSRER